MESPKSRSSPLKKNRMPRPRKAPEGLGSASAPSPLATKEGGLKANGATRFDPQPNELGGDLERSRREADDRDGQASVQQRAGLKPALELLPYQHPSHGARPPPQH